MEASTAMGPDTGRSQSAAGAATRTRARQLSLIEGLLDTFMQSFCSNGFLPDPPCSSAGRDCEDRTSPTSPPASHSLCNASDAEMRDGCFFRSKQRSNADKSDRGSRRFAGNSREQVMAWTSWYVHAPAVNKPRPWSKIAWNITTPKEKQSPFGYHKPVCHVSGGMYPGVPYGPEAETFGKTRPMSARTAEVTSSPFDTSKIFVSRTSECTSALPCKCCKPSKQCRKILHHDDSSGALPDAA
mmetsp:Transcript_88359/g.254954  ORF Transcript_88359/g.254954 Transcript_88359/m.254954 type:complete len:242 (-) Transcript_88359:277-1002(-)